MRIEDDPSGQILHAQMAEVLLRRRSWPNFPRSLEDRFERDRRSNRAHHLRVGVWIALIIYDLFLITDYHFFHAHFLRCVVLRLGIVTPLLIGTCLWLQANPPKRLRETMTLVVSCMVSFTTLYLWHGESAVATAFAQAALVLVILFVNVMMRLRFSYALTSTFVCVTDSAVFLRMDQALTSPEKVTSLALVTTGAVFTLVANYWMEREERLSYLLHLQVEQRGIELAAVNEELTRLSNLDGLTGLANRRHFSTAFANVWQLAILTCEPVSLMLIDLDHFKEINDDYGHLKGDEILVRVAQALENGLRCEEAKIARYGGEEFVIVLPGVCLDEALVIAERLRLEIRTIKTSLQEEKTTREVTVSVGVASTRPTKRCHPEELLRDADLALYQAKTDGRDCVRAAVQVVESRLLVEEKGDVELLHHL